VSTLAVAALGCASHYSSNGVFGVLFVVNTRYLSIATGDGRDPLPTYESISGIDITEFYQSRLGPSWDGYFTVVIAWDPNLPTKCNLIDPAREMYLGWRIRPEDGRYGGGGLVEGVWPPVSKRTEGVSPVCV
jgi:hypothetical protein